MDRSYKEDIPKMRRALEDLRRQFAKLTPKTDWTRLRIEPLLDHVNSLERVLRSPKFAREVDRLRKGVSMFHADLTYFRQNIKALKEILALESESR